MGIPTRALEIIFEDPETSIACFSGSITEALVHPQKLKKLIFYLLKASIVGYFLASFVSPAIAEKFQLTKKEAIATSFICGYAGIRMLAAAEKVAESKLNKSLKKDQLIDTDSENDSDVV